MSASRRPIKNVDAKTIKVFRPMFLLNTFLVTIKYCIIDPEITPIVLARTMFFPLEDNKNTIKASTMVIRTEHSP